MDLVIFTGNIGCGKSLLASKFAKKGYVVVNNDSLTTMIGGGDYGLYDPAKGDIYHAAEQTIIEESLKTGFSVVIDRTCMSEKKRNKFIEIGKKYKANIISYNWGPGTIEGMERRNKNHLGISASTWKSTFDYMFKSYEVPIMSEGFDELCLPPSKYKFYAFDFDGTIVDNEFPKIGPYNGNQIIYLKTLWEDLSNIIIIWTCRSGDYINQMREFLIKNKIPFDFINENPIFDSGSRKIFAHEYIDDRNSDINKSLK